MYKNMKNVLLFSDNSRKYDWKRLYFSKTEESIFPLILFEISVMEKNFPSDISKSMSGKIFPS